MEGTTQRLVCFEEMLSCGRDQGGWTHLVHADEHPGPNYVS
jgi:hypothetical protein